MYIVAAKLALYKCEHFTTLTSYTFISMPIKQYNLQAII